MQQEIICFQIFLRKIIKLFCIFSLFCFLFKKLVYLLDWIYFLEGEGKSAVIKISFFMTAL